jgi:NADH:ubiquinone oxidoreductase subunit B-like Fe-S oxidoreductase
VVQEFCDIIPDVYIAGDCKQPQTIMQAVHDGFNIAVEL